MEININKIFKKDGFLKEIIPAYEYRDEQLQMADFILERLYEYENGLIEAGTGTGKTLAYLVPTLLYSIENDKKISLTTETKALQKQLMEKDIPLVKDLFNRHLDLDFTYSLCLGSSNYPCRRRFETVVKAGRYQKKDTRSIGKLSSLFDKKEIFTRFDVVVTGSLWTDVNREPDACLSFKCHFSSECPYQNAKKEWLKSDILVMNHYLFFTNVGTGKTYLPDTDIVVFDEAHSLEDIASRQLGFSIGYNQLHELIERFYHSRKRNHLIKNISSELTRKKLVKSAKEITSESSKFFEKFRNLFGREKQLRLTEPVDIDKKLIESLKEFMSLMTESESEFSDDYLKMEYDIAMGRLFVFTECLSSFVYMSDDNYVYWTEKDEKDLMGDISLMGQPVTVSDIMHRDVISFYDSSLFVSATLATGKDFSYMEKKLGLDRHRSAAFSSSFDYNSQMVLYLASGIPDPADTLFMSQSAEIAAEIIRYLGGNCLVLFTSYKMLGTMKKMIADLTGLTVYSQDDYTSTEAVAKYLKDENSILMGTHSFWQGIDLPGDILRGVIMMKLPFAVPDTPINQARIERINSQGLNSFMTYLVPDAVIKFRQGFGRLIRSSSDRGIVAMMDPRISRKSYGRVFIKSIPECSVVSSVDELKIKYNSLD